MNMLNMSPDEEKCSITLFQWECKAREIYGNKNVKGFMGNFRISLSEDYFVSFDKPFEVKIEIARDLIAHEKILNDNKEPAMDWIKNEIEAAIEILKDELKEILGIMKRSKRIRKISVFFKTWSEEIPATTIYQVKKVQI
ncbi:MAG: hypothetical protein ACTSXK_08105 [Promethearchaeota archaeon]